MTGLQLSWNISDFTISKWLYFIQAIPSLLRFTTGHMTLRFEIFWRETANWQRRKQASLVRENDNCAESSGITASMWIQVCIGHSGVYRGHYGDVKGRLFVVISLIWYS